MMGSLLIITSAGKKEVPLRPGRYTIGRGDQANIQIISQQISRVHAEIIVEADQVRILDRGSANGTAVNGRFVTSGTLQHNDQIMMGDIVIQYLNPEAAHRPIAHAPDPKSKVYLAATKVIVDRLRPRSLWPLFALVFAMAFLALAVTASLSFQHLMRGELIRASMNRGHDLVRYMAEKNREDLRAKNELLLDIETFVKESGVREAFLIDRRGRILAPISHRNHLDNDPFTIEALNQKTNQKILPSPSSNQGTYTFVHPIRDYNKQTGQYETLGAAKIIYSPEDAVGTLPEATRLLTFFVLSALAMALTLAWIASRALSSPIHRLAEKIHQWRSGQGFAKESTPFKEWAPLYEAVDLALDDSNQQ